ncbi:hypothetical protein [Mycolicibacter minnesotensis]
MMITGRFSHPRDFGAEIVAARAEPRRNHVPVSAAAPAEAHLNARRRRGRWRQGTGLAATCYQRLPYPESQLMALAHSLVARGVIDETELRQRLAVIRARLEAE